MSDPALDAIRAQLQLCQDEQARERAELSQLGERIKRYQADLDKLQQERESTERIIASMAAHIDALKRAEAILIEHAAPDPVEPDPVVEEHTERIVREAKKRTTTLPDLDEAIKARHEAIEEVEPVKPKRQVGGTGPRYSADPEHVRTRRAPEAKHSPKPHGVTPIYEGGGSNVDIDNLSPTDEYRANMLLEFIIEAPDGEMSQIDMTKMMVERMGCREDTGQGIAHRALTVLYKQGYVEFTGRRGPRADGALTSAIYRFKD